MDDLDHVKSRARRGAEIARGLAAAKRAPWLIALVAVIGWLAPSPVFSGSIVASLAGAALALRLWRRSVGAHAIDGILVGAPVALAGLMVRVCAPSLGDGGCGIACVAMGLVSTVVAALLLPRSDERRDRRATLVAFAAATAFAGCAGFGVGIAAAAALTTAAAWTGARALHGQLTG